MYRIKNAYGCIYIANHFKSSSGKYSILLDGIWEFSLSKIIVEYYEQLCIQTWHKSTGNMDI